MNKLTDEAQSCYDWLIFHRIWGNLPDEILRAIASKVQLLKITPQTQLYQEGEQAKGCYLLKWGFIEIYRQSPVGKTHISYCNAGDSFGYLTLLGGTNIYETSAIALNKSEVWLLPQADFKKLIQTYIEIQRVINDLLSEELAHFVQRITREEARIQGLQDYIKPVFAKETVIGTSKASQKLRSQIEQAAGDLKPVILTGASGTGKTFVAQLIHRTSGLKDRPFAEINCADLPRDLGGVINTDPLFGRIESKIGVIELLEQGTLLINNIHLLAQSDRDRLVEYLKTGQIFPNPYTDAKPQNSWVRLILASPAKIKLADLDTHQIKLFPLAQRKEDIPQLANYFLEQFSREAQREQLQLDQADLRRLISYDYPANIGEMRDIMKRAVTMTPLGTNIIPEQVLWSVQSPKNAFKVDLLNHVPWLRPLFLSQWWPKGVWLVMMIIFVPVTIWGFIGPLERENNILLNLFWAWWWPFYLLLFPFIGRLWCAVCPFMITAEWLRNILQKIVPYKLLPWPTKWLNQWGAWLLFGGFLLIYLWEKLWDLPHTPYLSAWLLLIITAGAVIFSLIYEKRLWCRYLCPIGGMNGMFAKLAMTELRSTQQVCGSQCTTYGCYKGSEETPVTFNDALSGEGQATQGCPIYSHPAQLKDNRDCILCMTCLKACPHRSIQFNLRFPAADIFGEHIPMAAEVALLLLLLGGVFMHKSHRILSWLGWGDLPVDAQHLGTSLLVVISLLSIPALVTYLIHRLAVGLDNQMPSYLKVVYAYLPLTLAANLAYYVPAMLTEAGKILPVFAHTLGYSGVGLPTLTWSMDVAVFMEEVTLVTAIAFSIYPLLQITKRPIVSNLPHILGIIGFVIFFIILLQ